MGITEDLIEEIEALKAIYDDTCMWFCGITQQRIEFILDSEIGVLDILHNNTSQHSSSPWDKFIKECLPSPKLLVRFDLPELYPHGDGGPTIKILAPWMTPEDIQSITKESTALYEQNLTCLFNMIESIRTKATSLWLTHYNIEGEFDSDIEKDDPSNSENLFYTNTLDINIPDIFHSEPLIDRKSIFQGFAAKVTSVEEVFFIKNLLTSIPRIARATHNILAYSISKELNKNVLKKSKFDFKNTGKGSILNTFKEKDHDSDGETAAGGRLQFLITTLSITNVMVMVSRWYGGKKLGPDRFKHISNVARNALQKGGFIK